ncbi:type II toxin-antitoxin system RelE/ParE family toxin [Patescibacteria group bacterium]|nr:type II toxin-antitoxin system RelE/ParE family toxin [Patescibacteria group bacterium]MBU4580112.1 type II toxin-antitoxin system RelE/ParE family toxin [Patescibacteria group bacterium]
MKILKTKDFEKSFEKLPANIQALAVKKIFLFKTEPFYLSLKTHKLKGKLKKIYSFSVNQQYRILFEFLDKNKILLFDIGTHEIYK